jgi:hypothetical protein
LELDFAGMMFMIYKLFLFRHCRYDVCEVFYKFLFSAFGKAMGSSPLKARGHDKKCGSVWFLSTKYGKTS